MLKDKTILLIITGGVAAYKSLELIRLLKKQGATVNAILTKSGQEFITPLAVSSLSETPTYTELFDLKDETEMGHIRLSREADIVLVAPATANTIAKIAHGIADDLASATLLATDKQVLVAPAMNPMMWKNPATQANLATLKSRNITILEPNSGEMACGEIGQGRMQEPEELLQAITKHLLCKNNSLKGKKITITSGPTYEPIDPVRFIGNRSSGKQGHAIANALKEQGATVTLISGPVNLPDPEGIATIHVETASDMLHAVKESLPCDVAIFTAAVCDWSIESKAIHKMKKGENVDAPTLTLKENPDILRTISNLKKERPELVIGFAAETEKIIEHAKEKLTRKGCDIILANDVSTGKDIFGGDENQINCLSFDTDQSIRIDEWPRLTKDKVGEKIADLIVKTLKTKDIEEA